MTSVQRARASRGKRPDTRRERLAERRERLSNANFASAIYGEILLLAVLAALGEHEPRAGTVLATVVSSQLVFWLAHAYAETIGQQLRSDDHLIDRDSIGHVMEHEWPIVQAAGPTIVLMGLAAAGVLETSTAIDVAIGIGVLSLVGWGFAAGRRSRDTLRGQLLVGALSGALGLAIVALKLAIH
jgi:hypothetical protein